MLRRIKTEKLKSLLTSPYFLLQYYHSTQVTFIQGKVVVLSPNMRTELSFGIIGSESLCVTAGAAIKTRVDFTISDHYYVSDIRCLRVCNN